MHERYSRQLSLKGFGEKAQSRLLLARVLVVGAGGLGCPALQYLAAAGVGVLGVADDDVVELSNLHRQVLYTMEDIGLPKVDPAAARLRNLNPDIELRPHCIRISNRNALELIEKYDIVVDGTDNFTTRYLLSDACVLLGKPLVFGGLYHYEGQVAVFNVPDDEGRVTHYRHLFPEPPSMLEAPGCNEAGVLGLLPGIIGMLQAVEVVKLITDIGQPLINRLLTYNLLTSEKFVFEINNTAEPEDMPRDLEAFMRTDYERWCTGGAAGIEVMDAAVFRKLVEEDLWYEPGNPDTVNEPGAGNHAAKRIDLLCIDVREKDEKPLVDFPHLSLPLSELSGELERLISGGSQRLAHISQDNILFFCQSGVRSMQAAMMVGQRLGRAKKLYTLSGGLRGLAGE